MKRPLIHKGFYREMVRQLRAKGLVAIFILLALNLITFASFASQDTIDRAVAHTGAGAMASPMLLFLYIAVPIMTFGAYRWLNKRVQSDFYHAIPLTRTQIYASTSAAILFWLFLALGSFAVTHAILYAVFAVPFNYLLYLCVFINMLLAAITILGAFSIACALSGKRFVAFFSAFTILLFPRSLLSGFWMLTELDMLHFTPLSRLPFFLNPAFNIAGTPIHSLAYGIDYANVIAMLYSLLYGAGLGVLGCVAFNRRKSEAAIIPYASKVLQAVTRIAFGMPSLALMIILLNVNSRSDNVLFDSFLAPYIMAPTAVMAVVFSFIFYCLYELISSKKMKSVVKSMALFPICIAIGLILAFVPAWLGKTVKQAPVSAETVKSYRFYDRESSLLLPYSAVDTLITTISGEGNTYADVLRKKQSFSSAEGAKAIADGMEADSLGGNTLMIRDGSLFGKSVDVNYRAANLLTKLCLNDERYAAAFYAYPKGSVYYRCTGLTPSEAGKVGRAFKKDYEALTNEQREQLMQSRSAYIGENDTYRPNELSITLYGCRGTQNYTETFRINELTPNAAKLYLSFINERYGKETRKILREYVDWMETGRSTPSGDLLLGSERTSTWKLWDSSDKKSYPTPKDANQDMYLILKALSEAELTDDITQCVAVGSYTYDYSSLLNLRANTILSGFRADESLMKALSDWMEEGSAGSDWDVESSFLEATDGGTYGIQ